MYDASGGGADGGSGWLGGGSGGSEARGGCGGGRFGGSGGQRLVQLCDECCDSVGRRLDEGFVGSVVDSKYYACDGCGVDGGCALIAVGCYR